MEINIRLFIIFVAFSISACAEERFQPDQITDVYVADFSSDDIKSCRPSDVDLSNHEAKEFFIKSKQVDHKVIHDHYNFAPCYIEGTLKYKSNVCEWEIRAGATGHIKCGDDIKYFACDTCEDLFEHKE